MANSFSFQPKRNFNWDQCGDRMSIWSGCYVDMANPLPLGAAVKVRIEHRKETFAATAGVVYSVPHLGMGLVFRDIEAGKEGTLEQWLPDSATAGT